MYDIEGDSIGVIAQALIEKFGRQARDVAERQLIEASEESRGAWREVVISLN